MATSFRIERAGDETGPRIGVLETGHGAIPTPALVPIAVAGAVQSLLPSDLSDLGVAAAAIDVFELGHRPGVAHLASLGGLRVASGLSIPLVGLSGSHRLLGWTSPDGPAGAVATGHRRRRTPRPGRAGDDGLHLPAPQDDSLCLVTPETAVAMAETLGADLALALDEPLPPDASARQAVRARDRTIDWARRGLAVRSDLPLVGAIDLASPLFEETAGGLAQLPFFGYAFVASTAVSDAAERLERGVSVLPPDRPRILVGCADPAGVERAVRAGVDVVVTDVPIRLADFGWLLDGTRLLDARQAGYEIDGSPIVGDCDCVTCRRFSRAYVRHLFLADELLGYRLGAIHNLRQSIRSVQSLRSTQ